MLFYYNNAGAVEWLDVGLTTLGKATMSRGMNHFVFVVYSNALATLILLSSSFFINRYSLSHFLFLFFFFLSICSITVMQNCVFTGIDYSSPTLGSAMSNLTPAITFVLAVILGMEKLNIGSSISQIKVMGTVLSIAGALLVTLYKGSPIISFRTQPSPSQPLPSLLAATSNWVIGGLFFATAAFSTVVFLGETLHVGSVIGAVVIAIGFYTVLWAQSKEENAKGLQVDRLSSPSAQASPLLETVPRK
ncbi:WAT1-related protein At5g40230 [Glycine max]|uniref:WAT1-related protein At5g40230 n=1 Tax=Glycine max TaxID=3847 RepID=UPI0003DEB7F0|nr:WAT1-related protein At5g40230 [Glycine max]|eukprot:XP_006601429.1 WAT1-related protein At5g40230 [Glycine max]